MMWAMTTATERTRARLLGSLDATRDHVLEMVDGLDEADLRRPVLPSGWSCLDLVKHLTYDEEIFWFRAVVAGEQEAQDLLETPQARASWTVSEDESAAELLDRNRAEISRSNAIVLATDLDAPVAWWPEGQFGSWRLDDLEEVLLHLVVEVACHAGHLDAARELIDGRQYVVLT
jgi:hypothetical protein